MFGLKKETSPNMSKPSVSTETNIIIEGTSIEGDISSTNDIRLDGTLVGNLECQARVLVGKKGKITGELHCNEAIIEGHINGNLLIQSLLQIKATSIIDGDISTHQLIVESGATINGSCKMKKAQKGDRQNHAEKAKNKHPTTGK